MGKAQGYYLVGQSVITIMKFSQSSPASMGFEGVGRGGGGVLLMTRVFFHDGMKALNNKALI